MSCKDAMIPKSKVTTTSPDAVVKTVMQRIRKKGYRYAIVVDKEGRYMGRIGARTVIKRLLPKVATIKGALGHLNFVKGAEPGFAKNFTKLKKGRVEDVMRDDIETVKPSAPAIEGMRVLVEFGGPIAVVEPKTKKFLGIITEESILERLSHTVDDLETQLQKQRLAKLATKKKR